MYSDRPPEDVPDIITVRIRELEPGLVLARAVHSSDGTRLKQAGEQLDEEDVNRLRRWKTGSVYVFDPEDTDRENPPLTQTS